MRTRTRKILSLLLATAMVFTMNTFVMAEEVTVDAAENEPAVVEEAAGEVAVEGATEDGAIVEGAENVDDVFEIVDAEEAAAVEVGGADTEAAVDNKAAEESNKDAVVDEVGEVDGTKEDIEKDGWKIDDVTGVKYSNGTLTLSGNAEPKLTGSTDSKDITIESGANANTTEADAACLDDIDITKGTSDTGKVTIKFTKNSKIGYDYISIVYDYTKKEGWEKLADYFDISDDELTYTVDASKINEYVTITYTLNTEALKAINKPYGEKTVTAGTAKVTYYENIPFFGTKTPKIDSSTFKSILGDFKVSGNGTTYAIKKITLKRAKNSNTATIKKIKFTTKAKDLEKAIKSANITFKIYPWNLSHAAPEAAKLTGKSGKYTFSGKIGGKKFSFKQGKKDKMGSTTKIEKKNNQVTVSNNAFVGSLSTNKITDKSK